VDGGGHFPRVQERAGNPADLPQVRRDDPWARVLLVFGVGADEGIGGPSGGPGLGPQMRFIAEQGEEKM
jgi:hypothetical protein